MSKALKAVLVAAVIAIGPTAAVQAAEKLRVVKSAAICFCFLPADLGKELGVWEKRGLDLEITSAAGEARMQQAMVAGSADIGLGGGPGLGILSKGVPAKSVAAIFYRPSGMALIVPKGTDIAKTADLKGKKIGVTTGGSLTDWLARKALENGGLKTSDAQIVPLGDLSSNTAALTSGSSQAMVYGAEAGYSLQVDGTAKVLTTFDNIVTDFIAHAIFAPDKLRQEKPEAIRQFVAGWLEVIQYMRDHKAETIAFAEKTLQLKPGVAELIYNSNMPQMTKDGSFPEAALETLNQSFVDLGILPAKIDVNSVIDRQFLPK
jgi:ABC-type nitrate/sulfonate/bicarbonate transport system substrate-binding protein